MNSIFYSCLPLFITCIDLSGWNMPYSKMCKNLPLSVECFSLSSSIVVLLGFNLLMSPVDLIE
jgi:hypothetical protein